MIKQFLLTLLEPYSGLSLEELGFAITVKEELKHTIIQLSADIPLFFLKENLSTWICNALSKRFSALNFSLELDFFIRAHQTQMPGHSLRGVKNVIAIGSGKGGVGKSTVTVNLAIAMAKAGARVGVLDADIYGPSIPLLLGKHAPTQVQNEYYLPVATHGIQAMSIGYLTNQEQALIWRGPMLAKSLLQMINLTYWDELDYLFIDLPPGTGDIQLSLVQKIPLTAAVVVTTPQQIATLDAKKALIMFEKTNITVAGLVENMVIHQCPTCGHQESIFAGHGAHDISQQYNIPILGRFPLDAQISSQSDLGDPIALSDSSIARLYLKTAFQLALKIVKKPLNYADKFPPIVVA